MDSRLERLKRWMTKKSDGLPDGQVYMYEVCGWCGQVKDEYNTHSTTTNSPLSPGAPSTIAFGCTATTSTFL